MTSHPHDHTEPYRDPARPVDERVADLLARMTLDEKLAQLGSVWIFQIADADGLDAERAAPLLRDGIGSRFRARRAVGTARPAQRSRPRPAPGTQVRRRGSRATS